jgi:hypothetical protein
VNLEQDVTTTPNPGSRSTIFQGQAAISLIGVAAMAAIFAVNLLGRPHPAELDARAPGAILCSDCGTVVAVRRSPHSVPVTLVEVQMMDGSLRTVRAPAQLPSVGDVVQINGDALTLRDGL